MTGFVSIALERRLSEDLARAQREAADLTPAMDEISEAMLDNTRERFMAERGPSGVPWKRSQEAIAEGRKTLQKKGFLIRSLDRRSGATFAEVGVKPGAPQQTYAAIHQFGGTIVPRAKKALSFGGRLVAKVIMPARPYLGFGADDRRDITAVLMRFLRRVFGEPA